MLVAFRVRRNLVPERSTLPLEEPCGSERSRCRLEELSSQANRWRLVFVADVALCSSMRGDPGTGVLVHLRVRI